MILISACEFVNENKGSFKAKVQFKAANFKQKPQVPEYCEKFEKNLKQNFLEIVSQNHKILSFET